MSAIYRTPNVAHAAIVGNVAGSPTFTNGSEHTITVNAAQAGAFGGILSAGQVVQAMITDNQTGPSKPYEIVTIIGINGATFTIRRGQENTAVLAWNSANSPVISARITQAVLDTFKINAGNVNIPIVTSSVIELNGRPNLANHAAPLSACRGNIQGLDIDVTPTQVTVSPGMAVGANGNGFAVLSASLSKNPSESWQIGPGQGCLQTGLTLIPWQWYFLYIIHNPTTNDTNILLSNSPTVPGVLPSGYTVFRRIAAMRYENTNWLPMFSVGDYFHHKSTMGAFAWEYAAQTATTTAITNWTARRLVQRTSPPSNQGVEMTPLRYIVPLGIRTRPIFVITAYNGAFNPHGAIELLLKAVGANDVGLAARAHGFLDLISTVGSDMYTTLQGEIEIRTVSGGPGSNTHCDGHTSGWIDDLR